MVPRGQILCSSEFKALLGTISLHAERLSVDLLTMCRASDGETNMHGYDILRLINPERRFGQSSWTVQALQQVERRA
jgi:hypothetical protein